MKRARKPRGHKASRTDRSPGQQVLFLTDDLGAGPDSLSEKCEIVAVGRRRDGGTRYWCLSHKADATAKYGKPAKSCRAAHIPPITSKDVYELNLDKYKGGVALWGAVPAVYDTTLLPMDRGIHVHARVTADSTKETDHTFRAVRIVGHRLPKEGILVSELDAIYYMASSVFGPQMKLIHCLYCGYPHLDRDWFSVHPHRRHLCAGCGKNFRDNETAIGNPISGVRDACAIRTQTPTLSTKELDINQADFPGGIQIWGSNPAFLWTGEGRKQRASMSTHFSGAGRTLAFT